MLLYNKSCCIYIKMFISKYIRKAKKVLITQTLLLSLNFYIVVKYIALLVLLSKSEMVIKNTLKLTQNFVYYLYANQKQTIQRLTFFDSAIYNF